MIKARDIFLAKADEQSRTRDRFWLSSLVEIAFFRSTKSVLIIKLQVQESAVAELSAVST